MYYANIVLGSCQVHHHLTSVYTVVLNSIFLLSRYACSTFSVPIIEDWNPAMASDKVSEGWENGNTLAMSATEINNTAPHFIN